MPNEDKWSLSLAVLGLLATLLMAGFVFKSISSSSGEMKLYPIQVAPASHSIVGENKGKLQPMHKIITKTHWYVVRPNNSLVSLHRGGGEFFLVMGYGFGYDKVCASYKNTPEARICSAVVFTKASADLKRI